MSQSPERELDFAYESGYAKAARQLNKLVRSGKSYSGHERNRCFLNIQGGRFANASMVSGFDFPEDGRAVAICDWDGDGDQDLWVANRTAPQLRFMQNELKNDNRYVSLRLEGTESNRDAVGARIAITLNGSSQVLSKSIRAGEGFLSCGSRRVTFGVGEAEQVSSVVVRWPNGRQEEFGSLPSLNASYLLKEGSKQPENAATLEVPFAKREPASLPPQSMAAHNFLSEPLVTPPLTYQADSGLAIDLSVGSQRPMLINLWASWCQPCIQEISEWAQSEELNQQVEIVCLHVDESGQGKQLNYKTVLASKTGFRGVSGIATAQLLDTVQQLQNVVYDHHRPLPVPTTLLLDVKGNLRAIYKGATSAERILADVDRLNATPELDALPFAGRWLGPTRPHELEKLVEELFQLGYQQEAEAFVERLTTERYLPAQIKARLFLAEQLGQADPESAIRHATAVLEISPDSDVAHERLGLLLARKGQNQNALQHFQQAVRHASPPRARTHYNYGRSLRATNQPAKAKEQFLAALKIDPAFAEAHVQLGLMLAANRDIETATEHFQAAVETQPTVANRVNLAMSLEQLGRHELAWAALKPVFGKNVGNTAGQSQMEKLPPNAVLVAAQILKSLERDTEAIGLLERFLQAQPNVKPLRQLLDQFRQTSEPKR